MDARMKAAKKEGACMEESGWFCTLSKLIWTEAVVKVQA
jgi:hypothetical protein